MKNIETNLFKGNKFKNMPVKVAYSQNNGRKNEQEDFMYIFYEDEELVVGLADGIGKFEEGKKASQIAINSMVEKYNNITDKSDIPHNINESILFANEEVYKKAKSEKKESNFGTTLLMLSIINNQLYWMSVGDSRIYLIRNKIICQVTTDQIYGREIEKKIEAGEISRQDGLKNSEWNELTDYIGMKELKNFQQNIKPFELQKNDKLLICSDGLYKTLSNDEILEHVKKVHSKPQKIANDIVKSTVKKKNKYQGNISVIILCF